MSFSSAPKNGKEDCGRDVPTGLARLNQKARRRVPHVLRPRLTATVSAAMRRTALLVLVVLELVVAVTLVQMGRQLPARAEMEHSFTKVENVTRQAERQIHQVRDQVHLLRQTQLEGHLQRMQKQLRALTKTLREQTIDFQTVAATRDALGSIAKGLQGLGDTLDPRGIDQLGAGLKVTAVFLEDKLLPAAQTAADQLDKSVGLLQEDARLAARFLRELPSSFDTLKEMHDSLAQFDKGLSKMAVTLHTERLQTMRAGFDGMYVALSTGADQVERLGNFTYPVLTFDGLKPEVEQRAFWPEGERIAAGLRKAGKGVKAADAQMGEMLKNLPDVEQSLRASHKVVASTRAALAEALAQKTRVEPVLKELPSHAAKLADNLPRLGHDLAQVLRQTESLKEVATALHQAQRGLQDTARQWPELRKAVLASARVLQTTQEQLDRALNSKEEYEDALAQTIALADASATLAPLLFRETLRQLEGQEKSLDQLGNSLGEVGDILPHYGHTAGQLIHTGRWLAWLVAAIVLLHALYVLAENLRPKSVR